MKICYLIQNLMHGGAEVQLISVAIEQARNGHDITIITLFTPDPYFCDIVKKNNIKLQSYNLSSPFKLPWVYFSIVSYIRKFHPDVVHAHMYHSNIIARLVSPFFRKPLYVNTAHNIYEGGKFRDFMYRSTDFLCDVMTNVSQAAVDRYNEKGLVKSNRCVLTPNGVDAEKFSPNQIVRDEYREKFSVGNKFVWLVVASFTTQKDFPNLLNAYSSLRKRTDIPCKLYVAGSGPLKEEVEKKIFDMGLSDSIVLLGPRNDTPSLFNMADGYVMASAWEGLPIVLLEALSSALPCVVTNVGGNCELIVDDRTGYIVEPKNSDALASAMLKLMAIDASARKQFGDNGRNYVISQYGISSIARNWLDLYRQNSNLKSEGHDFS